MCLFDSRIVYLSTTIRQEDEHLHMSVSVGDGEEMASRGTW